MSIFFYREYMGSDENLSQKKNEIQKNNQKALIEENNEASNIIENLRYVSKDLLEYIYHKCSIS